jgi:AcrR family transcriptional regulator
VVHPYAVAMKQEARSERSRAQILAAALNLFASQGYRGTNMREIAEAAGVSTGNVYHQFPDKESIFKCLLDEYAAITNSPDYPFNRALADGAFPNDLARLGEAARVSIEQNRPYALLFYVDVIEFQGRHIRMFYENMCERYERLAASDAAGSPSASLRDGVSAVVAMQLTTRFLFQYFIVEILFGVPNHYGRDTQTVLAEMSDILGHGMLPCRPKA